MNFIAALRLLEVVRVWVSFMQSQLRRIQKIKIFMYIFKTTNAISFVTVHVYTYIYAYMHFQIIFPSLRAFKFAKSKQKLFGVTRLWVYSTPSIVGFIYIQTYIHTYAHIYHNAYINILYCFLLFLGRIVWAAEHALRQPVVYVDKKQKPKTNQNTHKTA